MRVDLGLEERELGLHFFIGDLFVTLLGAEPLVDHFDAGAEYEQQEENRDIAGRQQGLIKITRPSRHGRGAWSRRRRLETAEEKVIDTREASVKDQQAQDQQDIEEEFLSFQEPGNKKVSIEVVEGDQERRIYYKKGRQIPFGKKREVPGTGIKCKG